MGGIVNETEFPAMSSSDPPRRNDRKTEAWRIRQPPHGASPQTSKADGVPGSKGPTRLASGDARPRAANGRQDILDASDLDDDGRVVPRRR